MEVIAGDDGKDVNYFSCPQLFVPRCVREFLDRKLYLDKYPHTAVGYDDVEPRFRAMESYWLARVSEYRDKQKRASQG